MQFGNGFNRGRPTPPVNVGDELDVTIEAVGTKGDGIAKKNGFVLFVPNVKEGERVRIRVTKVLQKVGFAEVVEGAEPAPKAEPTLAPEAEPEPAPAPPAPRPEDSETFGEELEEPETPEEVGIQTTQEAEDSEQSEEQPEPEEQAEPEKPEAPAEPEPEGEPSEEKKETQ